MTDNETILYYDALLQENTARVQAGLQSTDEYKRLSDMADFITALFEHRQSVAPGDEKPLLIPKEVRDFMEAFDRYNTRRRLVM